MRLITVDRMGAWAIDCDDETSAGNTGLAEKEESAGFAELDW